MKKVEGYVFCAGFLSTSRLFGQRVSKVLPYNFENLQTNGIVPYERLREANEGAHKYQSVMSDVIGVKVGELEMQIAESATELKRFRNKSSLIVVSKDEFEQCFWGQRTENGQRIGHLPGMHLTDNGFQQFLTEDDTTAYEKAEYLLSEINRQAQTSATIATFNLHFLK